MNSRLLYRVADHNGGLVFAPEDRARRVARIHEAIETAKTWADFRRAMPRLEYSDILRRLDDCGEPRPKGSDEFSGEMLPGWSDGDFPPWLQSEMSRFMPAAILERYGKCESTHVNGSFWWISPDAAETVCAELAQMGWRVEHAPELPFW